MNEGTALRLRPPSVCAPSDLYSFQELIIRIVSCWMKEPPEEWYMGADVWKPHRHPLGDDGGEARASLCTSRKTDVAQGDKVR